MRAKEVVLGLGASRKKPVASNTLAELEALRRDDKEKLIEVLGEETGRSARALENALNNGGEPEEFHKLLVACGQDKELAERIAPFRGLLREDSFERLVVVLPGGIYVGQGSARRSTGTHYTPRSLTEPIVQHTLEPLVYQGPAEGLPKEQWRLRSPKEILELKVCDMAMGSGAFLVQVCRYLSERLVEAWENLEKERPGQVLITPEGEFSQGEPSERLIPKETIERLAIARRLVADRCLYGVDINPMAVEMAKLSIWLITVDKSRPFTFLDHALKCGDSLVGTNSLQQIENFSLRTGSRQITFSTANLFRYVDEASTKRRALEALPSDRPDQIEVKNRLHVEAETATTKLNALADCLVALELCGLSGRAYEDGRELAAESVEQAMRQQLSDFESYAREQLPFQRTFHWPLEFPEVFERSGFDAFVGNPPFMGGLRLSEVLGDGYNSFLMAVFGAASKKADLCAYFFLRAYELGNPTSTSGLLATNTISQGVTRRTALDCLVSKGCSIYRSVKSFQWPGQAAVIAAMVHFSKRGWKGVCVCDHKPCQAINSLLDSDNSSLGQPMRLIANIAKCYQGATMWGDEFFIEEGQAKLFLSESSRNSRVVRRAMGGRELNNSPSVVPGRWAINFGEMEREEAETYDGVFEYVEAQLREKRSLLDRDKYERVVVCWWKYFHSRSDLFDAIARLKLKRVLARSRVSDLHMTAFIESDIIFTDALVVFLFDSYSDFSVLQSTLHDVWVRVYASTLKNDVRYVVSDCFETFPFPASAAMLEGIGLEYYEVRHKLMLKEQKGLTAIYNRFHDPTDKSEGIAGLRALHSALDRSVAAAYGWSDLNLSHGFQETKHGVRFTFSEPERVKVLDRLLALNHKRYDEEFRAGLHEKKAKSSARQSSRGRHKLHFSAEQGELL